MKYYKIREIQYKLNEILEELEELIQSDPNWESIYRLSIDKILEIDDNLEFPYND